MFCTTLSVAKNNCITFIFLALYPSTHHVFTTAGVTLVCNHHGNNNARYKDALISIPPHIPPLRTTYFIPCPITFHLEITSPHELLSHLSFLFLLSSLISFLSCVSFSLSFFFSTSLSSSFLFNQKKKKKNWTYGLDHTCKLYQIQPFI